MAFMKIATTEVEKNLVEMISKQWMLVTSGDNKSFNTMTASWGNMGFMWKKPVATIYVRPTRYTYEFIEKNEYFSLSFLKDGNRDALNLLGSVSGRDGDKVADSGLTPILVEGCIGFDESEYIFICKKLYADDIKLENFIDDVARNTYTNDNLHRMYISEIVAVYQAT